MALIIRNGIAAALALAVLFTGGCISRHTSYRLLPPGHSQHQVALEAVRAHGDNSPAYAYRYRRGINRRTETFIGIHSFDLSTGYKLKLLDHLAWYHTVLRMPIDGVNINPGFDVSLITGYGPMYGGAGFARFWSPGNENPGQNIVPNRPLYGIFLGAEIPLSPVIRVYPELTLDLSDTDGITGTFGIAAGFGRTTE